MSTENTEEYGSRSTPSVSFRAFRGHSAADALHFLRSCPEENDPLEFIFGDLVEDFSEAETRVICALTYFTLPAKVEHIAAVAGADSRMGGASAPPAGADAANARGKRGARAPSHAVDGALAVHTRPPLSPDSDAHRGPMSGAGAPRTAREGARAPQMHDSTASGASSLLRLRQAQLLTSNI